MAECGGQIRLGAFLCGANVSLNAWSDGRCGSWPCPRWRPASLYKAPRTQRSTGTANPGWVRAWVRASKKCSSVSSPSNSAA